MREKKRWRVVQRQVGNRNNKCAGEGKRGGIVRDILEISDLKIDLIKTES